MRKRGLFVCGAGFPLGLSAASTTPVIAILHLRKGHGLLLLTLGKGLLHPFLVNNITIGRSRWECGRFIAAMFQGSASTYLEAFPQFDPSLRRRGKGQRVITDPEQVEALLRHKACKMVEIGEIYASIDSKTSADFTHILKLLRYIPLFKDGDAHREIRAAIAKVFAKTRQKFEEALFLYMKDVFPALLQSGATVDLRHDFAEKIFSDYTMATGHGKALAGLNWAAIARIFDPVTSLSKRQLVDDAIRDYLATSDAEEDEALLQLAIAVLGHDPFVGSITSSLWFVMKQNEGKRLCDIEFPDELPRTAFPFVIRIVESDFALGEHSFTKGEVLRMFLNTNADGSENGCSDLLYGKGAHLCLGKAFSRQAWSVLTTGLNMSELSVSVGMPDYRMPDSVFLFPETCSVTFR